MNAPLAIYVVYHTQNAKALEIFSKIYKLFCRDIRNSLSDGLDIPVYFATEENDYEVAFDRAERTFIIILSDSNLVADNSTMIAKIRGWLSIMASGKKVMLSPVKLCNNAFDIAPSAMKEQFIVLKSYNLLEKSWDEYQTRLYDSLIRFVQDKSSKVQIFISHSKKDEGKIGEVRAKELAQYLRTKTKLNAFFDVVDILDGNRFDTQIEKGVENALLMILYTNTYSDREWCRRELIAAKDHNVPTIVVMMMDGEAKRVFPYIGNVPCIEYKQDWCKPINLLLKSALDEYHEQLLLDSLKEGDNNVQVTPFPPELYNLRLMPSSKSCVLYPEPPLGQEELTILKQAHAGINFVTPMEYASAGLNLQGKYIAISISNTEDAHKLGMGKEMLDDVSIEISKHILKAGGKMIYGGDLREGGFTELFSDLSSQYGAYEKTDPDVIYFKNFLAWPNWQGMTKRVRDEYVHNRVELVRVEKAEDQPKSITKMRIEMENNAHARILVGGKMSGYSGSMPGIIEEFKIALNQEHPIYVVGGFGGASRYVADVLSGDKVAEGSFIWINGLNYKNLQNGLSQEQNKRLFVSMNAMEIVSLILEGLKNTL